LAEPVEANELGETNFAAFGRLRQRLLAGRVPLKKSLHYCHKFDFLKA
jgi:hypothetical protein